MPFVFSLFDNSSPGLILPNQIFGWLGWGVMLAALILGIQHWWENLAVSRRRWVLALCLLIAAPIAVGFFGVRLPVQIQPMPNTPLEFAAPSVMFLAALPWVLAGGTLGPLPAVIIGLLTGSLLGFYSTHSPFTPLEIAGAALLFSVSVRQNYRTWFYRLLRHPLGSVVFVILLLVPLMILGSLFSVNDTIAVRLDFAFTQIWPVFVVRSFELLFAGLVAEALYITNAPVWGRRRALIPSPAESYIQTRFFYGTAPLVAMLTLSLIIGNWLVAGRAAELMIEQRLLATAQMTAESLPYFTETGQNLILSLADPGLFNLPPTELDLAIQNRLRSVPYFNQLFLFDQNGTVISGYPKKNLNDIIPTTDERNGINLALKGVTNQVYLVAPPPNQTSAQVSFIAAIRNSDNQVIGVMLGRTDLNSNPFTQPVIQSLVNMKELDGQGMILSETGITLYHPDPSEIMKKYTGQIGTTPYFHIETAPNNTRQFVSYYPVSGRPWVVVLTVPTRVAHELALRIAVPLLIMVFVFATLAFVFLHFNLKAVTSSLQVLSQEAAFISQGQLDRPLQVKGVDEVGRLSAIFEQMRTNLSNRLSELNSLLKVSQGVAANLEIDQATQSILEAALSGDACAARIVVVRDVTLDASEAGPVAFGLGSAAKLYAGFDAQLFEMTKQQDLITLPNLARTRRLQFSPGAPHPAALIALAIRHESRYYGVLWIAYDQPRMFADDEIRFFSTLAGEASLAATSARLYASAEVGRQRLEAVLSSTSEPVLVIDGNARLLLLNPAAIQVPGLIVSTVEGRSVQEAVGSQELVRLLTTPLNEKKSSTEIELTNGKTYYASVSSVMAEGQPMGRVCILRDITHFKELEQLKSDFVATVSHDLRSPLTLMRGYATMLQMVGDLNEQQKGYVRKIVSGVESMTRLVSNLLDLGRIEAGIGLQIEKARMREVIDEVINSLQLQATQKDIRLVQEIVGQNKNSEVEVDRALLQQAMYNLVENAVKYTAVGGQVIIRLTNRANSFLIEVVDTGIGIAPLDLPHLFEKFYRSGRREAYQQRGTGLGLAIVKSIAERHGGRVWIDSQLGKGSVFSIELPCEQHQKIVEKIL